MMKAKPPLTAHKSVSTTCIQGGSALWAPARCPSLSRRTTAHPTPRRHLLDGAPIGAEAGVAGNTPAVQRPPVASERPRSAEHDRDRWRARGLESIGGQHAASDVESGHCPHPPWQSLGVLRKPVGMSAPAIRLSVIDMAGASGRRLAELLQRRAPSPPSASAHMSRPPSSAPPSLSSAVAPSPRSVV